MCLCSLWLALSYLTAVTVTNFPSEKKNAVEGKELRTNNVQPLSADVLLLSATPKRKSLALLVVHEHCPRTALGIAAFGSFGEAV
jgi:hypothetical protein